MLQVPKQVVVVIPGEPSALKSAGVASELCQEAFCTHAAGMVANEQALSWWRSTLALRFRLPLFFFDGDGDAWSDV